MSEKSILEKVRKKFQTRRSEIEKESENKLQKLQDKIERIEKEREFFISAFYPRVLK